MSVTIFITFIHVVTCILIIAAVLLQSVKGAETGVMIGGSSQTLFGARGASSFLAKMTVVLATLFMVTSLTLSLIHQSPVGSSIMLDEPMKALPAAPVTPNAAPGTAQAPAKK